MDGYVVRLRGLPWSATIADVADFFEGCEIADGQDGIHLTQTREGRATGSAFVEFASEDDVMKALEKNKQNLGNRYIEVFRSKKSEMDWVVKRSGAEHTSMNDACVKLRGLPFGCSKEEIAQFFSGFEIVPNGIMQPEDRMGRGTGEAFVQFASQAIAERALGKHKERIGHRYIEIFKSCLAEANAVTGRERGFRSMGRPGPYDRGDRFPGVGAGPMGMGRGRGGRNVKGFYGEESDNFGGYNSGRGANGGRFGMMGNRGGQFNSRTGHWVRMRGLPFQAMEQDIVEFFAPLQAVSVNLEYGDSGRPSGVANVEFASHQDALKAMKKHRSNMQHRYIELFLNSSPEDEGYGSSGMGGGGYGGGSMGNTMDNGMFGASSMGSNNFSSGMGSRSNMGDGYGGQFSGSSDQYGNSSMGSSSYMGSSSGQSSSYGNQGYSMGGGGYSSMGGNMSGLANPNYTAF